MREQVNTRNSASLTMGYVLRRFLMVFLTAGLASLLASYTLLAADHETRRIYTLSGNYEDVRLDLEEAIISQGLVIDYTGHLGKMLERTKDAVGGKTIFKNAHYFTFCSAKLSHKTMAADPTNIAICPYKVFLYELADKPGVIHLGYRRAAVGAQGASLAALKEVDALLERIIREAMGQ